jgi:selenide,water dikinase
VLAGLLPTADPRLLVGPETLDDAAALEVSDDLAICFTADIITPLVDDAHTWGRIAAANSISDIYAMGATPLAALNVMCWPNCLPLEMLRQVLAGGAMTAAEADCLLVGGHTIDDKEPKYGMAVIGTVHPDRILTNRGARPGDRLYLSKRLGTGIIATAVKAELAGDDEFSAYVDTMATLNRCAAEAASASGVRALTDVTGFGLVGHLNEMLGRSENLGVTLKMDSLPQLPGVTAHMEMGLIPGGAYRNRDAYQDRVVFAPGSNEVLEMLLYDPQTSGGVLAAVPPVAGSQFEQHAADRGTEVFCIGEFDESGKINVV